MGMIGNIVRVQRERFDEFKSKPSLFEKYVRNEFCTDEEIETLSEEAFEARASTHLELDKAWGAISFLLNHEEVIKGAENPDALKRTLSANQILDLEQDMGYGPAQYLTPEQVKASNVELEKIEVSKVKEIVPDLSIPEHSVYAVELQDPKSLDYVLHYFEMLKDFYKKAAHEKEAILTYIT